MNSELSSLTIKQKLGQLFMFGFEGHEVPEHMEMLFRDYYVGGIIYFRRNTALPQQIAALSSGLQQLSSSYNSIPLAIAVDQEGGMVARIDREVTVLPGQMTLGATGNAELAYEAGRISAMELAQLGITVNFAPVLDVNNNPLNPVIGIRSFGERPELVAQLGSSMIRGYQEMGLSACAKHFPGHGDTTVDSHQELPSVAHSLERIHAVELVPFKAAIAADVDMIMTAHVQFPALEPDGTPATLSPRVLTDLLRKELGFSGVIVTDCLEMNAISQGIGIGRGAVEAFKAGADLILVSHRLDRQLEAYHAMEAALATGEISEQRLDQSVARLLQLKHQQQRRQQQAKQHWLNIGNAKSLRRSEAMMEQAVTLVQDQRGHLPLLAGVETLVIWPEVRQSTEVDEVIEQELTLGKQLIKLGLQVEEMIVGTEPTQAELINLEEKLQAARFKQVIVGLYNASFSTGQQRLVELLQASKDIKVVYISLRNPYDIALLSERDSYVCAYENRPAMLRALGLALSGKLPFRGRLPVTLTAGKR